MKGRLGLTLRAGSDGGSEAQGDHCSHHPNHNDTFKLPIYGLEVLAAVRVTGALVL